MQNAQLDSRKRREALSSGLPVVGGSEVILDFGRPRHGAERRPQPGVPGGGVERDTSPLLRLAGKDWAYWARSHNLFIQLR